MGTEANSLFSREMPWAAAPGAVTSEVNRVATASSFFRLESHSVEGGRLKVVGVLSRKREYSGEEESLRIRLEYPDDFPRTPPRAFDHDRIFQPGLDGHQFADHGLCLAFPARKLFSQDPELVTAEVVGAAFSWMIKRNIFERSGRKNWPGEAEPHGYARPYRILATEQAHATGNTFLQLWVEWAIENRMYPLGNAPCPCLSGKALARCHRDLAELVINSIFHATRENT